VHSSPASVAEFVGLWQWQAMGVQSTYRPELDGLRAIAILAVVIFHISPRSLQGGYLGVDVFFVISGYLILGRLIDEAASSQLGLHWLLNFVAKRALRLFVPLACVIAATVAAMPLFPVLPNEAEAIRSSAPWAALFFANHYFALDAGYFSSTSDTKPLLHIWSLAVEEQFYFAVALVALVSTLARPQTRILYVTGMVVFCASFAAWIGTPAAHDTARFFLLPWRAWEFLAGGIVAVLAGRLTLSPMPGFLGVALIAIGIATSDGDDFTRGAILTTAGSAALLMRPDAIRKLLVAQPMVWIGRVSYGWYLWHWPVLFYARTLNLGKPDILRDTIAALLALLLAWIMYRLVEYPLRALRSGIVQTTCPSRNMAYFSATLATLVVAAAIAPAALFAYTRAHADVLAKQSQALVRSDSRIKNAKSELDGVPFRGSVFRTGEATPTVLVLGDSYAHSLAGALLDLSADTAVSTDTYWSVLCAPIFGTRAFAILPAYAESCWLLRDYLDRSLASMDHIRSIVLFANWRLYFQRPGFADHLRASLRRLAVDGRRVLIVAQSVRFSDHLTGCAVRSSLSYRSAENCREPRRRTLRNGYLVELRGILQEYRNVRLIDLADGFCDSRWCRPHIAGETVFMDHNHLNPSGARAAYKHFRESFLWVAHVR
jgi:peptidoglycan/LPS O-acetylase OafA/YrhL